MFSSICELWKLDMRFLPILAALAIAMGGALTAEAQGIPTPQPGNLERTAVMDGLRRFFGDGSLRFVVKTLKVAHTDKRAIAYTEATTANGIGGVFLLIRDVRGMWKIGWSEGHGTSDCATVAHSFGSAKVLIESYGIKPDALIPDFTENNYNSLQWQAQHHPDDPESYDRYCVAALDPTPYLGGDERVLALVEAERDRLYLDCPCHNTEVVYTSRQRLVCMGCGHLHCVLAEPLAHHFDEGLSNVQWDSAFDEDGEFVDDTSSIPVIDYREIEPLAKLWIADAWREAIWLIDFYATATPEEIANYERGLPSAEDLIEAGFHQVATQPSAAAQLNEQGYGFDIAQNAAAALGGGAVAYSRSKTDPKSLREAVLQVFHATELVLKIRLEQVTPGALAKRPNNPSVMQQLKAIGIMIRPEEVEIVESLRALRNHLQHDCARYAYRNTRRLIRRAFVFLDRFSLDELKWWIGEVIEPAEWAILLEIDKIRRSAEAQAAIRLREAERSPGL